MLQLHILSGTDRVGGRPENELRVLRTSLEYEGLQKGEGERDPLVV